MSNPTTPTDDQLLAAGRRALHAVRPGFLRNNDFLVVLCCAFLLATAVSVAYSIAGALSVAPGIGAVVPYPVVSAVGIGLGTPLITGPGLLRRHRARRLLDALDHKHHKVYEAVLADAATRDIEAKEKVRARAAARQQRRESAALARVAR